MALATRRHLPDSNMMMEHEHHPACLPACLVCAPLHTLRSGSLQPAPATTAVLSQHLAALVCKCQQTCSHSNWRPAGHIVGGRELLAEMARPCNMAVQSIPGIGIRPGRLGEGSHLSRVLPGWQAARNPSGAAGAVKASCLYYDAALGLQHVPGLA